MMMNSQVMVYRIDYVKKVQKLDAVTENVLKPYVSFRLITDRYFEMDLQLMFPVLFMNCWSLYIIDTQQKIVMVPYPTETDPSNEMKRKHEALANKFQRRFCKLFKDMFGAGLVDTTGWSFLYPLIAQHEPCSL
jgi:hypothetical protein